MKKIFYIILTTAIFCSCEKGEKESVETPVLGMYGCVIPENDSDPVIFTSAEDNVIIIAYFDTETQLPSKVLVKQGENTFGIIFSNNDINLPIAAFSNDGYYLFGNYKDNSVSIVSFDKQSNFINRKDYQSESIAELISFGSVSSENKSITHTKANDNDLLTYFRRQNIKQILLAGEMFSCVVNRNPLTCISAVVDPFKAIIDATGHGSKFLDEIFVAKDFSVCAVNPDLLCAMTVANNLFYSHEDDFYTADDLSDNFWLQFYINDYIQIESHADNITENSADIISQVYFSELLHGYFLWPSVLSYREVDATSIQSIPVQLSATGWSKVKLDNLNANTFHEALLSFDVSTHNDHSKIAAHVQGNVVNFITLQATYGWQMAITLNIDGNTESYTTDLFLDGYPDSSGGTAQLQGFKHQTMGWSNDWYNGFRLGLAYFDPSVPDWNNNESNRCITFYGRLPADIGMQTFGSIEFSQDCFYGDCACGSSWSGTFAIIRVK
ncbi:MAG: hypothetical protein LBI60_02805 [Bacteroidales bacterium]|jgi:hypothetical protein|nr:hypothetical protein [Bacteroidales bacterium]